MEESIHESSSASENHVNVEFDGVRNPDTPPYAADASSSDDRLYECPPKTCTQKWCGCCMRGGCCRQLPPMIIYGPPVNAPDGINSNDVTYRHVLRVNLRYRPTGWFSTSGTGLGDRAPEELFHTGLTHSQFSAFMDELSEVRAARRSIVGDTCGCLLATMLPCFCGMWCRGRRSSVYEWDRRLREWQTAVNETLIPLGMLVKTQSRCDIYYDRNGKHRRIERWIAFAMTALESDKLAAEPHLTGDIENTTCCGGYDESLLCMHP
jgi:hypothetical protein